MNIPHRISKRQVNQREKEEERVRERGRCSMRNPCTKNAVEKVNRCAIKRNPNRCNLNNGFVTNVAAKNSSVDFWCLADVTMPRQNAPTAPERQTKYESSLPLQHTVNLWPRNPKQNSKSLNPIENRVNELRRNFERTSRQPPKIASIVAWKLNAELTAHRH